MATINLQKIVSVKGQPGLFHLVNYNPKGYFLQPFDGGSTRFFSNEKGKVLAIGNVDLKLRDNLSINLLEVFRLMESNPMTDADLSTDHIQSYFQRIVANLDNTVAISHLIKVVQWYAAISTLFASREFINEETDGLTII